MKEEVLKVLNDVRPTLQADGGDVELIAVDEKKGIVTVELKGACNGCPMATLTLQEGIARVLKQRVKGFKKIEAI